MCMLWKGYANECVCEGLVKLGECVRGVEIGIRYRTDVFYVVDVCVCVEGISHGFNVGLINKPLWMDITYRHHWGSTFTDGGEPFFPVNCHLNSCAVERQRHWRQVRHHRTANGMIWSWEGCGSPPWLIHCQSVPSALLLKSSRKRSSRQSGCLTTDARHIANTEART